MHKGEDVNVTINDAYLKGEVLDMVENVTFCFIYFYCPSFFV